jgi:RNA polymerase sigma-70 factor (sigma-E family)
VQPEIDGHPAILDTMWAVTQQNSPADAFIYGQPKGGAMTFEEWFGPQLPRLLRFATVLCSGHQVAEDVVQDVAIKAHARWSRIESLQHPGAYLRRMVVNEHLSWRRKWSRIIPEADLREPVPAAADFTDQHADRAELITELAKLPRRQRAVLVLRYLEGLGDADISGILGCSQATVRSHASRALASLRIEMSPTVRSESQDTEEGSRAH